MLNHEIRTSVLTLTSLVAFLPLASAQAAKIAATPSVMEATMSPAQKFSGGGTTDVPTGNATEAARKAKRDKVVKGVHVEIEHAVLMVDGWPAKADLNFDINDIHYLYVWAPNMGTVVISNKEFPGSSMQENAFNGSTLSVKADKHQIQLISDHALLGKKPEAAYVAYDKSYNPDSRYPEMGYGETSDAPYSWPGSLADSHPSPNARPLPPALQPVLATKTTCRTMPDGLAGDCVTTAMTVPPTWR